MKKNPDTNIGRAVGFDIGVLDGTLNAIIMRLQHTPLTVDAPAAAPNIFVFVLDRDQAADLSRQLLDALGLSLIHI